MAVSSSTLYYIFFSISKAGEYTDVLLPKKPLLLSFAYICFYWLFEGQRENDPISLHLTYYYVFFLIYILPTAPSNLYKPLSIYIYIYIYSPSPNF